MEKQIILGLDEGIENSFQLSLHGETMQLKEENLRFQEEILKLRQELSTYVKQGQTAFSIGDALYDGIYLINGNQTVMAVNKAFSKMTGIAEKEIIGRSADYLVEKNIVKQCCGTLALSEKKKLSRITTINNQKIVVTANPIFDEWGEISQVLVVMRDVTELIKLQDQLEYSEGLTKKYITELNYFRQKEAQASGLLGHSPLINQVKEVIYQVAQANVTVLVMGETGVGKEVVANEIYKNSQRKDLPYIKVNCAAIPESLLESELFGYEKGAFTGALNKEKLGLFEIANSGTLLLDEIGEMPLNLQSKLLRVLQEKEITRIGGSKPIKLDVRVIAATNQDLESQVAKGTFRQDLYYRLNVIPIKIPPLRERIEDIAFLAKHFLTKCNEKYKVHKHFEPSALNVMQMYDWPGNVRELENLIEHLVILNNQSIIESAHILKIVNSQKLYAAYPDKNNLSLKDAVNALEKQMISNALKTHGSTHKAAKALGVSQPTVLRKARELGVNYLDKE